MFTGGKIYSFSGGNRELETLKEFVTSKYESAESGPNPFLKQQKKASDNALDKLGAKVEPSKVPSLGSASAFHDAVSSGRWLVAFVASWCGHCKALAPTLESLVDTAERDGFHIATVDCDDAPETCRQFGVTSFPTIFLTQNSYSYRYEGDRSQEGLRTFATTGFNNYVGRPFKRETREKSLSKRGNLVLLDDASFDEETSRDAWLVGFTCTSEQCRSMEKELGEVQKSFASQLRVALVDCAVSPALCKEHRVTSSPTVLLFYQARGFRFTGEHKSSEYFVFVSSGFRNAPSNDRVTLGEKRRLSLNNYGPAVLEDFVRQNRYLLVISFLFALLVWGVFLGSSLAYKPADVIKRYEAGKARVAASKKQ